MTSLDDARVGSQHHTTGVVHLQDVRVTFPGGGTTGPVSFTVEPGRGSSSWGHLVGESPLLCTV